MSNRTIMLADQEQRDLAATDLSESYIVEAAAGTGKTTLLIDRILFILRETLTPVSRMVAITFTEKAAGELKVKLRTRLEQELRDGRDVEDHYRKALLGLDAMPVSTIHAFCRELIQERPVEAGVDPDVTLADPNVSAQIRDEVWSDWLRTEFSRACPAVRPWLELGVRGETGGRSLTLRQIFDRLVDRRDELATIHVLAPERSALVAQIQTVVAQARRELGIRILCTDADDLLARQLSRIDRWLEQFPELPPDQLAPWFMSVPSLASSKGRKENWLSTAGIDSVRQILNRFKADFEALRSDYLSWAARELIEWLKGGVEAYQREKQRRGLLDFDDLLIYARNMLRDHASAREELKQRYDYLLVDEFQDTDSRQAELVCFLAERQGLAAEDWRGVVLDAGKLFIVGDPKQSIYRFRRADLDLYGEVKRKVSAQGRDLQIWMNFRCDPAIIAEVNAIFADLMVAPEPSVYEPEYIALSAAAVESNPLPPVVILSPDASWRAAKPKALECAQAEAGAVAAHIARVVALGVGYGDIAILYPRRTHLEPLEDALRLYNIPFDTAAGRSFGRRIEIQALRTVLSAIQSPFDEASVAGALRSPFFACSDEDLLAHKLSGADFNYVRNNSTVAAIAAGFASLREWHRRIGVSPSSQIVRDILERTPALPLYAMKPRGEGRLANLLKVLDAARSLEQSNVLSLQDLSLWLDRLDEHSAQEEESAVTEAVDSVVRLSTFHQSKGLEYPVVILYQLAGDTDRREQVLFDRRSGALEVAIRYGEQEKLRTGGYDALHDREAQRSRSEQIRLLYVAMTRAKQQLVLPLEWRAASKKSGNHSYADLLRAHYGVDESGRVGTPHAAQVVECPAPTSNARVLDLIRVPAFEPVASDAVARAARERADWQRQVESRRDKLVHARGFARASDHAAEPPPTPTQSAAQDRAGAIEFGNFVHRALQLLTLPAGADLPAIMRELAGSSRLPESLLSEAHALISRWLRSELVTGRIAVAERVLREVPFAFESGPSLCEGSIDLLFWEHGLPIVVDYKTDNVTAAAALQRAASYASQLSIYADAVERATGQAVSERLICFLRPGVTIPVAPV